MKARKYPGLFVVLEGIEGSGKSTLALGLETTLIQRGFRVTLTREPGGTETAERLRSVILESEPAPLAELLAYEAARADHVALKIFPALRDGQIVICDRFTASTVAYQGHARKLSLKTIDTLNRIATDGLSPDVTLWLDLPVKAGLARAKDPNRFERESVQFHERVRKGFLAEFTKNSKSGRWKKLAVEKKNEEEVLKAAFNALKEKLVKVKP